MFRGKWIYWVAQTGGWITYGALIYLASEGKDVAHPLFIPAVVLIVLSGFIITHIIRQIVVAYNWFRYSIILLLPRVIMISVFSGVVLLGVRIGIQEYMLDEPMKDFGVTRFVMGVINQSFLIFLWSSLYFTYHWFEKSRQEEIKNLRWEASRNEMELNNLKAQLNPHFMFNSMNSIRALIDENPRQAKEAITQLSTILRNTLLMGRKREVSLREELDVVRDYLSLESIRYEERLRVDYQIDNALLDNPIPPLLLQTAVENAIKHGISALPQGGDLLISIAEKGNKLVLDVSNTGTITRPREESNGIGLMNAEKRLELMYGADAQLRLWEKDGMVHTTVELPKSTAHESNTGR
jgi:sensor histidine kinase YesM